MTDEQLAQVPLDYKLMFVVGAIALVFAAFGMVFHLEDQWPWIKLVGLIGGIFFIVGWWAINMSVKRGHG